MMFIPLEDRIDTMFDRDKVAKILMNLLSNAFKFTESGGYIHVQTGICDGEVVVSVKDSGIGISDEDKEHIFDRFYRVDKARSRETGGTGLGLSIVRDTVRRYGGWVTAAANSPAGSVFTVGFPRYEPEQEELV